MPYNTRRKSLSLPLLGIQLPHASRSTAHRSPPDTTSHEQPPSKKVKRSHTPASPPPSVSEPAANGATKVAASKSAGRSYEQTPPPSPGVAEVSKIDTEGINDDIVKGVIEQLEKTGNRPHLVKELAAILSTTLPVVESSANPAAIITSRLTSYLRRPWTALSPCPVGKILTATHPRRIYFHLTTSTPQPIPELYDALNHTSGVISPSLTSASADEEDEHEARMRVTLSPSPEVDLSSPELDDEDMPPTPTGSFTGRSAPGRGNHHSINIAHNHRAASPPLEGDEKEFTQTASSMRKRSLSQEDKPTEEVRPSTEDEEALLETEENADQQNSDAAATLFGHSHVEPMHLTFSSPGSRISSFHVFTSTRKLANDSLDGMEVDIKVDPEGASSIPGDHSLGMWDGDMRNPENVELDELDDLFGAY
ncbi:hypothetical protein L228DRAFT_127112 [Xylona heveae TC161]|uniref:GDS1 winged helix domain-containing protein n=1 Tax=Xylona heveae (strain CBS 132557 / TC161) TaxID=1328760 RepID=A0A165GR55_XYLHT|nr:hypothetical protein L228DRAFT_127112 [Xylona heveae TC161]KZF22490.1 hypothetical protein L228DRAFT_127112 [Xylona heveae TC161]